MIALAHSPWFAPLLAAALSAATLALLARGRGRLPQDHPSGRSLHDRPVSRVGGLAIWAGFLPAALLSPDAVPGGSISLAAWGLVTAISVVDDWRGVRPTVRLAVHSAAALVVAWALLRNDAADVLSLPLALAIAGTALVIVWAANLFNFMDGSDGLAAAMAICGFGAFGFAVMRAGHRADACFALVAATAVFLVVNRPPARAFMGDGGSIGLGFLAAVFGIFGIRAAIWPVWFPLLVFLPFVADATMTVLRRIARGDHLFEAHRTHYYQRLHRMGPGHRGTLLFYGALIAGTATSASVTLAAAAGSGWWVLGAWTVAIGVFFAGIDYHWCRRSPEEI
ncbi:MAG: glycosyltransferase family 4 protein [Betaproteobacteria bacterium]|nr:glycosyltransferase family 4 protein [Betaproteobacteria bacterium]